ncbi:MAG: hypothetical protein EPN23_10185 [Verrucomicrobia bacterium]|nr:MAG: hypothetical protein EPN23_10185 [Verrucomicrobiota bacterium]
MRTRKNRKNFSREAALPPPFFLLLAGAMVLALSYLWLNGRCEALGRRITQLENQKVELARKVKLERSHWESAKALDQVERLLQRHHVVMTWPDERSIVHLRRTTDESLVAEAAAPRRQYARAGGIAND